MAHQPDAAYAAEGRVPLDPRREAFARLRPGLFKARHPIENFFAKIKPFRAIATRYDKTAGIFLAAVYLASAAICSIEGIEDTPLV